MGINNLSYILGTTKTSKITKQKNNSVEIEATTCLGSPPSYSTTPGTGNKVTGASTGVILWYKIFI